MSEDEEYLEYLKNQFGGNSKEVARFEELGDLPLQQKILTIAYEYILSDEWGKGKPAQSLEEIKK